jgi:hypothetical protein
MSDTTERTLGRIEATLQSIDAKIDQQHDRLNNHGTRIGVLERGKAYVLGVSAAVGVVVGLVFKVLS